ncbi:MAG: HD-GYP domain-containing protein [Desulfovibrio sp.]
MRANLVNWDLEKTHTILVVEDSRFQRKTLVRQLKGWDFDILEATDGKDGLEQFERHSPKLIITDLEMPVMDGFDLIRTIRQREINYTYIIVLTALADKENLVKALGVGADDFIIKPVNLEELKVRLGAAERIFKLQSQDKLIFALAQLADCRSEETGNHLRRVKLCTRLLCEDLAEHGFSMLTSARISTIESMSVLHDIGKVAVPDSVLNKPGKYTKLEYRIMRKHTEVGGELLENIYKETGSEQLRVAKDIVMHHHEKWDGSGYPQQLAGENIPLAARIVALADVFDALGSPRCYKPSFSRERCRDIIVSESGKHFDPAIVESFLRKEDELWEVLIQLQDPNCQK